MIYKYLLEIRYRIFFSLIAWSFMMINCYYFKETLLYIFVGFSSTSNDNNLTYFLTTDVAEIFMSYIWLSYYVTNQITAIFVCCQLFLFFIYRIVRVRVCLFKISFNNYYHLLSRLHFCTKYLHFPSHLGVFLKISRIFVISKFNILLRD